MRIDEQMPEYDVHASHRVRIRASAEETWRALLSSDLAGSLLVRILMSVRSGRLLRRGQKRPLQERLAGTGFVELAESPNQEIVIGLAGRFWRPDGGRCFDLAPSDFVPFCRPGYAKVAWNFAIEPHGSGCFLSTETRVKCYGRAALRNFRTYWTVVKPFSGLIRRAMLEQVKRAAEAAPSSAAGA
ncbi:MAG: hypothetical protein LAN37_05700 [Acidobacteriia bacterium]|nr:hypothetical protein [Terriglobia bacterium]